MDKFLPILKENEVFFFSGGNVKMANKRFTSIKNDFCITFYEDSEIKQTTDDQTIKEQGFDFFNLEQINEFQQSRQIDFIGVVLDVGE